jgi:hypothetical protein
MTFASVPGKWTDEAVYIHTQSHNTEDRVSMARDSHSGGVSIEFPADYSRVFSVQLHKYMVLKADEEPAKRIRYKYWLRAGRPRGRSFTSLLPVVQD